MKQVRASGVIDPHMTGQYVLSRFVGKRLAAWLERILIVHARRPLRMHSRKQ
ncbi:MAG: hypothetical protein HN341_05160 [Verrucomicrobia bacterium]|jgi:hypothetical protein|nr:hypothetical protein [Verrucomicrobiota bacterium]